MDRKLEFMAKLELVAQTKSNIKVKLLLDRNKYEFLVKLWNSFVLQKYCTGELISVKKMHN